MTDIVYTPMEMISEEKWEAGPLARGDATGTDELEYLLMRDPRRNVPRLPWM